MLTKRNGTGAWEDPLRALDAMQDVMGTLFGDYERRLGFPALPAVLAASPLREMSTPQWSFEVTDEAVVVSADLPGFTEDAVEVSLEADTLTIRGRRNVEPPKGYRVLRSERAATEFARSWRLPVKVDAEQAEARLENGVFTLQIPKAPEAKPRRIDVKAR